MFKAQEIDMEFLGGKLQVQGFCWVLLEALGILGAFDFRPHSIIQSGVSPSNRPPFLFPPPLVSQPNALLDPQEGFCAMILELPLTQQILTRNIYLCFALLSSFAVQTCHLLITQPIFWPEICVTGKVQKQNQFFRLLIVTFMGPGSHRIVDEKKLETYCSIFWSIHN